MSKFTTAAAIAQREAVWAKSHGRCWYCGAFLARTDEIEWNNSDADVRHAFTVDHLIPKSEGGPSDIDNLVPACFSCNATKHSRPLEHLRVILANRAKDEHMPRFSPQQRAWLVSKGYPDPESLIEPYIFWFEREEDEG